MFPLRTPTYDVAVVGAGIVGLATADALAREGARVLVIETEREVALHQTGHNSGVIHSGLYYRPDSQKARLCRTGRTLLLQFCKERNVPVDVCGKLVVATREEEIPRLEALEQRGMANGLLGLERLGPSQIREREPHAAGLDGLLVPETGIVDFRRVAQALAERCREHSVTIRTEAQLHKVDVASDLTLQTNAGSFHSDSLVNCAGLEADRVARMCGLKPHVTLVPFRGEYYRMVPSQRELIRHVLYPVPDPSLPFLGVHFTRTVDGEVEIGPNAVLAGSRTGYARGDVKWADLVDMLRSKGFLRMAWSHRRTGLAEWMRSRSTRSSLEAMQRLLPTLHRQDIERAGSGVRAQAVSSEGKLLDDFVLLRGMHSLHVLNAPSPAATAALAIGAELADRLSSDGKQPTG